MKSLIGKKFGRLEVLEYVGVIKQENIWKCLCNCGKIVNLSTYYINKEKVLSCGCLQKEKLLEANTSHGLSKTEIYRRWASMKRRCKAKDGSCYDLNNIQYEPEWDSFDRFFLDMSPSFSSDLELDRIDVTKGYSKENCRWITHSENNYNKNLQANNSSGKSGVSFCKNLGKYRAYITINRKQKHLGLFDTFEEALTERLKIELETWGYNRP